MLIFRDDGMRFGLLSDFVCDILNGDVKNSLMRGNMQSFHCIFYCGESQVNSQELMQHQKAKIFVALVLCQIHRLFPFRIHLVYSIQHDVPGDTFPRRKLRIQLLSPQASYLERSEVMNRVLWRGAEFFPGVFLYYCRDRV